MTDTIESCMLASRAVVGVEGEDATGFLGDLVSGDIAGMADGEARYAALLSPQGKVLFDFIVFKRDHGYALDLPAESAMDLVKRLSLYKLRARVEVAAEPSLLVIVIGADDLPPPAVVDPRHPDLGFRAVVDAGAPEPANVVHVGPEDYHARRVRLGIPEAPFDFAYGEVFPHDIAMDQLNGVDFAKGCYVGQEVVSRMEHRGTARRRIVLVEGTGPLPAPGAAIEAGGRPLGTLGSVDGTHGIAIVRLDRAAAAQRSGTEIVAGETPATLRLPAWARYDWPSEAAAT